MDITNRPTVQFGYFDCPIWILDQEVFLLHEISFLLANGKIGSRHHKNANTFVFFREGKRKEKSNKKKITHGSHTTWLKSKYPNRTIARYPFCQLSAKSQLMKMICYPFFHFGRIGYWENQSLFCFCFVFGFILKNRWPNDTRICSHKAAATTNRPAAAFQPHRLPQKYRKSLQK